jgi:hypothetical protein
MLLSFVISFVYASEITKVFFTSMHDVYHPQATPVIYFLVEMLLQSIWTNKKLQ